MNLRVSYDEGADVLYLSVGEPEACRSEDDDEGRVWRYSKLTGRPSGVTIIGFNECGWRSNVERLEAEISDRLHVSVREVDSALKFLADAMPSGPR